MAASAGEEGAPITAINVTPLVDILLVVLIIFMATAPLIQKRVLKVDVPKAAHHEKAATEALQIVLRADREILLAGQKLSQQQLSDKLALMSKTEPDLHVTLSADHGIPYGDIVAFLDVLRGAGVHKIGLEVAPK